MTRTAEAQEPFSQPFPTGIAVLTLVAVFWFLGPRAGDVQHEALTVRAEQFAPVRARKEGKKQVWEFEDPLLEAINARLHQRPAKFKRS